MKVQDFSSIGRYLDPTIRSNQIAIGLTALGFVAGLVIAATSDFEGVDIILFGLLTAAVAFGAWAIGREFDPDYPPTGAFGAAIAIIAMLLFPDARPNLIALGLLLIALRVVNQTTGLAIKVSDAVGMVILAAIAAAMGLWVLSAISVIALVVDYFMVDRNMLAPPMALVALVMTIIGLLVGGFDAPNDVELNLVLPLAIVGIAFAAVVIFMPAPTALGDYTKKPLHKSRIVVANLLVLVGALAAFLWRGGGEAAWWVLLPIWTSFVGMIIYAIYNRVSS